MSEKKNRKDIWYIQKFNIGRHVGGCKRRQKVSGVFSHGFWLWERCADLKSPVHSLALSRLNFREFSWSLLVCLTLWFPTRTHRRRRRFLECCSPLQPTTPLLGPLACFLALSAPLPEHSYPDCYYYYYYFYQLLCSSSPSSRKSLATLPFALSHF